MSPAERRKAWVREYASRHTDLPLYGSEEWLAMPNCEAKWVAALRFAEGARSALEEDLTAFRAQCEWDSAKQQKRAEDSEFCDRRDWWSREWTGRGFRTDPRIAADVEQEWREWVEGAA